MKQLRGIVYVFTQNKLPTIARDEEEIGFPISERRGGSQEPTLSYYHIA